MAAIVVPFRGAGAKLRLAPLADDAREELARAMLGDVVAACVPVGETAVVTDDVRAARLVDELGARPLDDPGGGQGAAVAAALDGVESWPALVVNADVPCAVPHDLRALLRAAPPDGLAYVPAWDGTTNALALARPHLFAPLYGPGSAERFRERAAELGVDAVAAVIPNLADDVDTVPDLRRLSVRAGPRTQAAIATLGIAA
jgi:2-phospho-L-lactate/phosphoenolpyruvate guanylyltransferase